LQFRLDGLKLFVNFLKIGLVNGQQRSQRGVEPSLGRIVCSGIGLGFRGTTPV
jgi:hypothetical protein